MTIALLQILENTHENPASEQYDLRYIVRKKYIRINDGHVLVLLCCKVRKLRTKNASQ